MRRGTAAAIEFGKILETLRLELGISMNELGRRLGVPAATVSQMERAERALKEPKLTAWAKALEVPESNFRESWERVQLENPDPPLIRRRSESIKVLTLELLLKKLTGPERERVHGYIDAIIEERTKI